MNLKPLPIQFKNTREVKATKPIQLNSGQVFRGTVKQLFPEQTAEVIIGGQRMIAKLETPLKAGDSHYFIVASTKPDVQLKIVTGPLSQSMSHVQQIQQLSDSLMLPKSSEMQALLSHIVKEQIPLSREQLLQAEQLLKGIPILKQTDALNALSKMAEMKLPFTEMIFRSFMSGLSNDSMQSIIERFRSILQKDTNVPAETKSTLIETIQKIAEPFRKETTNVLLSKFIQILTNDQRSISHRLQTLNGLKIGGILPSNSTLSSWQSNILNNNTSSLPIGTVGKMLQQLNTTNNLESEVSKMNSWIQQTSFFSSNEKDLLQQNLMQLVNNRHNRLPYIQQLQVELLKAFSTLNESMIFHSNEGEQISSKAHFYSLLGKMEMSQTQLDHFIKMNEQSSQPLIQQLIKQSETAVELAINGKAFEGALKSLLQNLGFNYESQLLQRSTDVSVIAQQLKPQLVALLQNTSLSIDMKEQAEMIIHRMNGLHMMSSDNGQQQQIIMQLPLQFFGKQMDATLQWNGRLIEDGKIDPSYVRVLFYLNLSALKETVVDMSVQNRIVTVTIYHEDEKLEQMIEPMKKVLKEGLATNNYQLSGVFIKNMEEKSEQKQFSTLQLKSSTKGVDIRI